MPIYPASKVSIQAGQVLVTALDRLIVLSCYSQGLFETLSSKPISWTCSRLLTLFVVFHFSYSLGKMRARLGQVLLFSVSL